MEGLELGRKCREDKNYSRHEVYRPYYFKIGYNVAYRRDIAVRYEISKGIEFFNNGGVLELLSEEEIKGFSTYFIQGVLVLCHIDTNEFYCIKFCTITYFLYIPGQLLYFQPLFLSVINKK